MYQIKSNCVDMFSKKGEVKNHKEYGAGEMAQWLRIWVSKTVFTTV